MMAGFFAMLEARDPSLGRLRSYRLEAGTDLFGAWLVDVVCGRIGARGRRVAMTCESAMKQRRCQLVLFAHSTPLPYLRCRSHAGSSHSVRSVCCTGGEGQILRRRTPADGY
jgi:hypothetical protein